MLLNRLNIGQALKAAITTDFKYAARAAHLFGIDEHDLRRAWHNGKQANRLSLDRILRYVDTMGYEVHFTLTRKEN